MRGFTLLEVVISLFVVGVAVVLAGTLVHVIPLVRHAKNEDIALKIAANEIETVRAAGYGSLPGDGSFSDALLIDLPMATGTIEVEDFNDKTKQVTARVSWQETSSAASSTVELSTLITNIGGLR